MRREARRGAVHRGMRPARAVQRVLRVQARLYGISGQLGMRGSLARPSCLLDRMGKTGRRARARQGHLRVDQPRGAVCRVAVWVLETDVGVETKASLAKCGTCLGLGLWIIMTLIGHRACFGPSFTFRQA